MALTAMQNAQEERPVFSLDFQSERLISSLDVTETYAGLTNRYDIKLRVTRIHGAKVDISTVQTGDVSSFVRELDDLAFEKVLGLDYSKGQYDFRKMKIEYLTALDRRGI